MTKRTLIQNTRKWHRYLGLLLGIQFLLWTIGGLYFSWTNIDEIRGDNLKNETRKLTSLSDFISPSIFLPKLLKDSGSLLSLKLTTVLNEPYYEVVYLFNDDKKVRLIHATSGSLRNVLTKEEAVLLAMEKLNVKANVTKIEFLTETGSHHEYRGRPLPAYAVSFDAPANTTIYVSEAYANVQTFRSNKWRVFDFLWMLHTMDYQERDNFNNWLLRAFSIFGIFTILSGFSLYILTSKKIKSFRKISEA